MGRTVRRGGEGPVVVIAGTGSNCTEEAISSAPCQRGRGRCPTGRHALLQQADAGRALPAVQGDPRRRRHADHHLQHPAARRRHDASRPWRALPSCRTSSASRTRPTISRARCARAWRSAPISPAVRRGHDRGAFLAQGGDGCISVTANVAPRLCAEMHEAWQSGDFAAVRRDQRPPGAAARCAVRRDQPGAGQVRRLAARADASADGAPTAVRDHARDAGQGRAAMRGAGILN